MTCPYCLQTNTGTSYAFSQEKDIDAEIEHIEDLISSLITARSRLRKKRNAMRCPIYSLPSEILALIFKFACPPLDFLRKYGVDTYGVDTLTPSWFYPGVDAADKVVYPQIIGVLSAVSTLWHSVVLSTPSLWTSFVADDKDLRLMQTVLARSGNLPISASLMFPNFQTSSYQSTILNPISREHAARIRMLHVRGATRNWLKKHIPRFINLESLCLEDGGYEEVFFSVENPCTHLVLKRFTCRISLVWSKIRVLHLINIPVSVSLEILERCTHLIEFRLRNPVGFRVKGVQLPSSPFTLPCLKLFEWPLYHNSEADRAVLQYARMPALQALIWNCLGVYEGPSDVLFISFFEHLSLTLTTLLFEGGKIRSGLSMFSHFLTLSGVKHLILKKCSDLFMDDVFSKLASEMRMFENREMPVLPQLQSICMDSFGGHLDQETVLETFRRRCSWSSGSLRENAFRLNVMERQVDWTPEFQEGLNKMVKKGCKVELWESSKPVDWLSRTQ